MLDKQIHANDLKLRILMTNTCNQFCSFCLNDFQPKTIRNGLYINRDFAEKAINSYSRTLKNKYNLQVYFSGGEPTLHPHLLYLMKIAKIYDCYVVLNTNGMFFESLEKDYLIYSDEIHFGVYKIDQKLADRIKRMNGKIQCVFSSRNKYVNKTFIDFYISYGIPIKVFQDFDDQPDDYLRFIAWCKENYSSGIEFRYTGLQENRGIGCIKCNKKCITLKAAWLFPNNSTSPCPQNSHREYPITNNDWDEYFMLVHNFHKKEIYKNVVKNNI